MALALPVPGSPHTAASGWTGGARLSARHRGETKEDGMDPAVFPLRRALRALIAAQHQVAPVHPLHGAAVRRPDPHITAALQAVLAALAARGDPDLPDDVAP